MGLLSQKVSVYVILLNIATFFSRRDITISQEQHMRVSVSPYLAKRKLFLFFFFNFFQSDI